MVRQPARLLEDEDVRRLLALIRANTLNGTLSTCAFAARMYSHLEQRAKVATTINTA